MKISLITLLLSGLFMSWVSSQNEIDSLISLNSPSLNIIYSYDEGLKRASELNKPIFLLFTGKECENNIIIQTEINSHLALNKILSEEFVNVWLYVDDKTPLPQHQIMNYREDKWTLRTIGNKWAYLEVSKYASNAQPLFVVIDGSERVLKSPMLYCERDTPLFDYVQSGLSMFQKQK